MLLRTYSDKVVTLTINNPKSLNALNEEVFSELDKTLDELRDEEICHVIIITGAGEKAFAAGADIKEFPSLNKSKGQELSARGHKVMSKIENYTKPIIAAINGYALGGGLELALACHIRLASDQAKLGLPEVTLGIIPGYGGTQRFTRAVGLSNANYYMMTGQMMDAKKALELQLISQVFPHDTLQDEAFAVAKKISNFSTKSLASIIKMNNLVYRDSEFGLNEEQKEFGKFFDDSVFKKQVQKFLEKNQSK